MERDCVGVNCEYLRKRGGINEVGEVVFRPRGRNWSPKDRKSLITRVPLSLRYKHVAFREIPNAPVPFH